MQLNDIQFGNATWEQCQMLSKTTFIDTHFTPLTSVYFPENDSKTTKEELNELVELVQALKSEPAEMLKVYKAYDYSLVKYLKHFLISKQADETEVNKLIDGLYEDIHPFIMKLKYFFQRPRPNQLASYHKLKLFPLASYSVDSPSYPSAHAYYAKIMCTVIGNRYPSIYQIMENMAETICYSRLYMGLNYRSDINAGVIAAEKVLDDKEFKLKYKI